MQAVNNDLYAIVDLGSNSFHMKVARAVCSSIQIINLVKQKVRLAAGLNEQNELSTEAMERGWHCLALFAEHLQHIPKQNIRIVGTATLRKAKNIQVFLLQAEQILGHKIEVISGEEEAKIIYLGMAHTLNSPGNRLVIDIGGASTEMIIGYEFTPLKLTSLDMGCVTFLEKYFPKDTISVQHFEKAIVAAKKKLQSVSEGFINLGWELAIGSSGTVQAVHEILIAQGENEEITLAKLNMIKQQVLQYSSINSLNIIGLIQERRQVFVSGLAILIALFEALNIKTMLLANGALREGLLYGLIENLKQSDIQQRTITSLLSRFQIDKQQSHRAMLMVQKLSQSLISPWKLTEFNGVHLLTFAAQVYEIGINIDYKYHHRHGAYILQHSQLPGLSSIQQKIVSSLICNSRQKIDLATIPKQSTEVYQLSQHLIQILRVALLLIQERATDLPQVTLNLMKNGGLQLEVDTNWLNNHPLVQASLNSEIQWQAVAGWALELSIN